MLVLSNLWKCLAAQNQYFSVVESLKKLYFVQTPLSFGEITQTVPEK